MDLERTDARFQTTRWTLIAALRGDDEADRAAAAKALAALYWPAVYGYLRRSGIGSEEAAEVTQAFFGEVVLGRGLFERAEPESGRLRSLMMSSLKRYMVDRHRRSVARRERAMIPLSAFDGEESRLASARDDGPDEAFRRAWAEGVMSEAVRRAEGHFRGSGKAAHWELFASRVLRPAVHGTAAPALEAESARLGFKSAADGAAAVQTVKRRITTLLREVVGETVDPGAVDEELSLVRSALG